MQGNNTISVANPNAEFRYIFVQTGKKTTPEGFTPLYLHNAHDPIIRCDLCHISDANNFINDYFLLEQKLSCITASCHTNFNKARFKHGPFQQGSCVECHNPHGTINQNFLIQTRAPLCFSCHVENENMGKGSKYIHLPVAQGDCIDCHAPHESNLEYHLKHQSMAELCAGCHGNVINAHPVLHDPVASGDCNACHSPHVSEVKGLLHKGGNDLCLTCHEARKDEFASKYIHSPVKKDCTLCHDPHGSNIEYQLRTKKDKNGRYLQVKSPKKEICLRCHRKINPELTAQIEKSTIQHKPVQEEKCTVCHAPHSTNFKKQLKAPLKDICFSCHTKIKEKISNSKFLHGPVRTNDCTQCHLIHGAQEKRPVADLFFTKIRRTF